MCRGRGEGVSYSLAVLIFGIYQANLEQLLRSNQIFAQDAQIDKFTRQLKCVCECVQVCVCAGVCVRLTVVIKIDAHKLCHSAVQLFKASTRTSSAAQRRKIV